MGYQVVLKTRQPKFICNELYHLPIPQVDLYVDLLFIMFREKVLDQQIYITSESMQTRVYCIHNTGNWAQEK